MKPISKPALVELASEFAVDRQSAKKISFPGPLWRRAILIAQPLSVLEVCLTIKVHPFYFQKKIGRFNSSIEQPFSSIKLSSALLQAAIIYVESSPEHKLTMQGVMVSRLTSFLAKFFKGGFPCSK